MNKEGKSKIIDSLSEQIKNAKHFYLTDIGGLNAPQTSMLRRKCFQNNIELVVVKNTLLRKAMERSEVNYDELYDVLKGNTTIMFSEIGNSPAKLIKEVKKGLEKPVFKGAYVEECIYVGENQLEVLVNLKSKEELIGDIIFLLKSPMSNLMSSLNSGSQILAGVVKTLQSKKE